jgi:centromere protein C
MEDIDGMWSSPEKSPLRDNGFNDRNEASVGSDGMSMDEGTYNRPLMYDSDAHSSTSAEQVTLLVLQIFSMV